MKRKMRKRERQREGGVQVKYREKDTGVGKWKRQTVTGKKEKVI